MAIFRAVIAILIGLLLAMRPADATKIIVIIIGLLFLLTGIVSLVMGMLASMRTELGQAPDQEGAAAVRRPQFPFAGVGCTLFGLVLSLMPSSFIEVSMYILGAFLVLAGAYQIASFRIDAKLVHTPAALYVVSAIVMVAGIFIIAKPMESASIPMLVLGIAFLVYGAMEILLSLQCAISDRRLKKAAAIEAEADAAKPAENVEAEDMGENEEKN